jgi:hypothetical protein
VHTEHYGWGNSSCASEPPEKLFAGTSRDTL